MGNKLISIPQLDPILGKIRSNQQKAGMLTTLVNSCVATYYGVQIFNDEGNYVGMVNLPSFYVGLCLGGEDMKTRYMVSYEKVYRICANMEGLLQYW